MGVGDRFGSGDGVLRDGGCERMEMDVQVRCVWASLVLCLVGVDTRIPVPSIVCGCRWA